MPSYSTPSTNLSTGLSTKPTRLIPDYLAKNQNYLPLSVFFAGIPEQEADPDSLFGLRMPERKKKGEPKQKKTKGGNTSGENDPKQKSDDEDTSEKKGAQKGSEGPQRSQTSKQRPQSSVPARTSQAGTHAQGATQQGAQQQEVFMKDMSHGLAVLLDMALNGQSVARSEMTTTANVPTLPVPIGAGDGRKFLDRPGDTKRKKKKKKSLSRSLYILLRR